MPELVQSLLDAAGALRRAHLQAVTVPAEPDDIALGCECANPALQIERWLQEQASSTEPTSRNS